MLSRRDFLKSTALATIALRGIINARPSDELTLYVGTYTSGKSEGIYICRMNVTTGALTLVKSVRAVNPSFLAIDPTQRYLYAVNEVADFGGKSSGAVSAFAIEPATGNLRPLNQQASMGADPCHIIVDKQSKFVLVANYTGGSVAVFPIESGGALGAASAFIQHKGSSVNKERQEGPHAHCMLLDRSNRHALASDLGLDRVMIYEFNLRSGKLAPNKQPSIQLKPGAGPRHLALHPNSKYLYVINELNSTLTAFSYNEASGTTSELQTVSTLPSDFKDVNSCADVHMSPSGKFLYGSNRGHDSIVVFAIDESTGRLTYVEHTSTKGKTPRNFNITPDGRFLLAANQNSDSVVTFKIDRTTGRLTDTGQVAQIPSPVCLKFL